jgi:hypothetical protein
VIFSETIIPVDDVRLATGERGRISRIMVTFSNGGSGDCFDKWWLVNVN